MNVKFFLPAFVISKAVIWGETKLLYENDILSAGHNTYLNAPSKYLLSSMCFEENLL